MVNYVFTVMVFDTAVPVLAHIDTDTGRAYHLESPKDDVNSLFDSFKNFNFKIRRKDFNGNDREHDARMCASRILENGNADFRIEFSDVHLSFMDICYSCAFVSYDRGDDVIKFNDEGVIGNAIANL